jgi:tetratricopeptide (TPR) repeat protein
MREVRGEPRLLFRLIGASGVNYHEYLLDRAGRIVDVYPHSNGEWLSQTVRRGFLPVVAQSQKGPLGTADDLYLRNLPSILEMVRLFKEESYDRALAVFHGLPAEVKAHRTILMQRLAIALRVSEEEYDAALTDLQAAFPDDPSLGLVLIDYHVNRGDHERALQMVDRLDRDIGGDPYLDFLRANLLFQAGRANEAKRVARRAIEAEPGLEDPYWTLVTISLHEEDYPETARLLTEIETGLGLTLRNLEEIPEYRGFVRSGAYAKWVAGRAATPGS